MKRELITLAIIAVLGASQAVANPRPDENFIPSRLEFEAPADHYQEWVRQLPCQTGHLKTKVTVFNPAEHAQFQAGAILHFYDDDVHQNGTTIRFETWQHVLPLRAAIQRTENDKDIHFSSRNYAPGQSAELDISWTAGRNFQLSVDGRQVFTMTTQRTVGWLKLMGVGSRTVFDSNELQCDLIA